MALAASPCYCIDAAPLKDAPLLNCGPGTVSAYSALQASLWHFFINNIFMSRSTGSRELPLRRHSFLASNQALQAHGLGPL